MPSRLASAAPGDYLSRFTPAAAAAAGVADSTARHTCSVQADHLGRFDSTPADFCQPHQQQMQQQPQQRRHSGSPRPSYACTSIEQQQMMQQHHYQQLQPVLYGTLVVGNGMPAPQQPSTWQQQAPSPPQQTPQQQLHGHSCYTAGTDSGPRTLFLPAPDHKSQPSSGGSLSSYHLHQDWQQASELSRRSAPLKNSTDQTASQAADTNSASLPSALLQQIMVPHQQPGSTDSTGSIGAATHGGFMAACSVGSSFGGAAGLMAGGFGVPPPVLPEVITAPRAPKALRDDGEGGSAVGPVLWLVEDIMLILPLLLHCTAAALHCCHTPCSCSCQETSC